MQQYLIINLAKVTIKDFKGKYRDHIAVNPKDFLMLRWFSFLIKDNIKHKELFW